MATPKKNSYIEEELEYLERKAAQIKNYVENPPMHEITDRIEQLMTAKGPVEKVVATIEAQLKSKREALKDYAIIIEAINRLRASEEAKKIEARGGGAINGIMASRLQANK
jgi:hypothetical protein